MDKKREDILDIIKGLGIICMVAGHAEIPFKSFVYLFHMAIFFIASGYVFNTNYSNNRKSLRKFIVKKIKTLWFPYVLWTTVYSVLHNFFININIYTNDYVFLKILQRTNNPLTSYWTVADILKNILKACLLRGGTQLGGALWFVAVLMEISVLYCIIDFFIKKHFKDKFHLQIQMIVAVGFLIIDYCCYIFENTLVGMDKVFSFYILYYMGVLLKEKKFLNWDISRQRHVILLVFSVGILYVLNRHGAIVLSVNAYVNPIFLLVASYAGWQLLYEIAFAVQRMAWGKKILCGLGKNTLSIVILHFLCFKIVNYIGVILQNKPHCLVAAFPILYTDSVWWIAYTVVGTAVPVALNRIWKSITKKVRMVCDKTCNK